MQTDEATARQRSISRQDKQPYDKYNVPLTKDQFDKHAKRLNPPVGREDHIVISGKHTFASQAKTVLKKIVQPRQEAISTQNATNPAPTPRPLTTSERRGIVIR